MKVLYQGHLERVGLGGLSHYCRDLLEPGFLGGTPTPLSGDEFEICADGAHDHRLDHSEGLNRPGHLPDRFLVELLSGLLRVGPDVFNRYLFEPLAFQGRRRPDENVQAFTQPSLGHLSSLPSRARCKPMRLWTRARKVLWVFRNRALQTTAQSWE